MTTPPCPRCAELALAVPLVEELRELRGQMTLQLRSEIATLDRLVEVTSAIAEITLRALETKSERRG